MSTDIDWQKVAADNGLTPDEFRKEIFSVAACIGAMDLDRKECADDTLKFTTSLGDKKIHVYVKYA
jgi:hypothetical protein